MAVDLTNENRPFERGGTPGKKFRAFILQAAACWGDRRRGGSCLSPPPPDRRMEQTQLLDWPGESDLEDPSNGSGDAREIPKPVGRLHLLSSKYGPEKDFWLYPGKNVIGRLESCQICLPASSVSKTHAVIEIPSSDGPHLLYDQKSLNRTRRQRMVLIPHVRYSLQDGDTLLFGDVGCQYFILDPEEGLESPYDSLEVPPTQPIMDANALVVEETPAPARKMGFGGLLVQDSDREEEDEEVVNGAGKMLHLLMDDGCDSTIKHGARGRCGLTSSVLSSPSATVVPESDEESGEPSESSPSCPSSRLQYGSDEAELRSVANAPVTPLNQETHSIQPGGTEVKVSPGSRGQPGAKDQDASTDPSITDFHLDSDTDLEDEEELGTASRRPAVKDDLALELGSDTDAEEPAVINPGVSSADNGQLNDIDSDTDVEEAEENPGILGSKTHRATENGDSDTNMEGAVEKADTESSESQEPSLRQEGSCKGEERADGNAEGHRPYAEADSDTDVEAVENPDAGSKTQPPTENEDDTDVEEPSVGVENREGTLKDRQASRDSDTDVEVADLELESLGRACLHSPLATRNEDGDADVEEIKGMALQRSSDLAEGAMGVKNNHVEPPKAYGAVGEQFPCLEGRKPTADTKTVEQLASVPHSQHLLAISVDSDTDVEEATEDPNEGSEEIHKVASDGSDGGKGGTCSGDLEAEAREDEDSDTDVEVASPSPQTLAAAHDSDTDVEVEASALPGKPLEEQETQLMPVKPSVAGEEAAASSATGLRVCCDPCKEDEDTDAEGKESHSGDRSDTDDEDDSDLAVQATQCYLLTKTSSPKAEKARDTADCRCDLEEEATQAFVFRSPSGFPPGKTSSSLLNDDDLDIYMLEATQPFCAGPATLSEEPTQAFIAEEEEDTEPTIQQPTEGKHLAKWATQPAVPASAIGGQQDSGIAEDVAQLCSAEASRAEPVSQPADGSATEGQKEEDIQTFPSVHVLPSIGSQPFALLAVKKASGSEEQIHVVSPEGGVAAEPLQPQGGAGCIEGGPEERRSELAGESRDAEQLPQSATDGPSSLVASVSERRRSLRSFAASSPPPLPEGCSSRSRSQVGSAGPGISSELVTVLVRRRGLRQLSNPVQYVGEPKSKVEEAKAEEASPGEVPGKGEPVATICHSGPRRSQRISNSASKPKEERATAASSPVTREPARPRKRRAAAAPQPVEEEQPGSRRTRPSRRSGGASETTRSPKDSRRGTQVGQEPAASTRSSGRRLQRQNMENKPAGTTRNQSHSSVASAVPAPKVLFTGVIDEDGESVVTELGGSLAESVFSCTHLVTDRVRRTVKFLCALARGIPIVTLDWLEKSKRNSFFLAPNSFLVCDPEQEKNFQFSLANSLQKAQQKGGVLQGYELHVTPNVKPEPEHMRDIIKCSGGTFLPRMPRAYKDKRVIISCPEDLPWCKPAQDAGIPIANSEFILMGILQQKADLDAHRLDGAGSPSLASPAASTRRTSKRRAAVPTTPAPPSTAKRRH